MTDRAISFTYV